MENISKALLIAAGILIAIMIISLILVVKDQLSSYYSGMHDSQIVEQTVEFNSKFDNYTGKTIRGNELVSIMNRIIDYNNIYTESTNGYKRIIISVDLKGHASEFAYDGNASLFSQDPINNNTSDTEIKRISELSVNLTSSASSGISGITETKLQKLSANIDKIVIVNDQQDEETRAKLLKSILGREVTSQQEINNIVTATKQYYQLTQFKRAMFKCTNVSYDAETVRVNNMTFEIIETSEGKVEFE